MEVSLTMWSCSRAQLPVIASCFILDLVRISLPAAFGFAPSVRCEVIEFMGWLMATEESVC